MNAQFFLMSVIKISTKPAYAVPWETPKNLRKRVDNFDLSEKNNQSI